VMWAKSPASSIGVLMLTEGWTLYATRLNPDNALVLNP